MLGFGLATRLFDWASPLVRERPESEFLFRHAPQLRQAMRFKDQEHDDQPAHDHKLQMRHDIRGPAQPDQTPTTFSTTGSSTRKAAPAKEPKIEPNPPIMIMNSTRNDFWMPKASPTSTAPR